MDTELLDRTSVALRLAKEAINNLMKENDVLLSAIREIRDSYEHPAMINAILIKWGIKL